MPSSHAPLPPAPDPDMVAATLRRRLPLPPRLAVILGSGFAATAHAVAESIRIPYAELPGFPVPGVPGHAGTLIAGQLSGYPTVILAGRAHVYEGHDAARVAFPIRVLAALGVDALLLTNAAGGIRDDLHPGCLVTLHDHLNLMGANPLTGPGGADRFVDMTDAYDPALRQLLARAAASVPVALTEGVYAAVPGPSYETPAEIRALRTLGADLVGMSTVPEVIVARHCRLRVAALSCITNRAAGLGGPISHEEVLATGKHAERSATALITHFAALLAAGG